MPTAPPKPTTPLDDVELTAALADKMTLGDALSVARGWRDQVVAAHKFTRMFQAALDAEAKLASADHEIAEKTKRLTALDAEYATRQKNAETLHKTRLDTLHEDFTVTQEQLIAEKKAAALELSELDRVRKATKAAADTEIAAHQSRVAQARKERELADAEAAKATRRLADLKTELRKLIGV